MKLIKFIILFCCFGNKSISFAQSTSNDQKFILSGSYYKLPVPNLAFVNQNRYLYIATDYKISKRVSLSTNFTKESYWYVDVNNSKFYNSIGNTISDNKRIAFLVKYLLLQKKRSSLKCGLGLGYSIKEIKYPFPFDKFPVKNAIIPNKQDIIQKMQAPACVEYSYALNKIFRIGIIGQIIFNADNNLKYNTIAGPMVGISF